MAEKKKLERILFGTDSYNSDKEFLAAWKKSTSSICKPCWEIKYCPYGPLVEQFPLLPLTKAEVAKHNSYIEKCLKSGVLSDGSPLGKAKRKYFEESLEDNTSMISPDGIPQVFLDASCNIFGHICPVFFVAEPSTETKDTRRSGRYIPRDILLKVVRRDRQICQECNQNVPDTQIEIDHIIPESKGGPVSVENLRVLCKNCNRTKNNSLEGIVQPKRP
jgi:hypothetical protein